MSRKLKVVAKGESSGSRSYQSQSGTMESPEAYLREAFSRNIGLLSSEEQEKIQHAKIAIPGMGGVGGNHLITLVRTGVGRFHLSDFDTFEPANLNRQTGARLSSFGKSKLDVMADDALEINPFLEIKKFPEGISPENIDEFLDGVDVVLDGLDFFNFSIRRLLFNKAREKGIHVVTAGPMGFSSAMLIFSPEKGMSFDEYFNPAGFKDPQDEHLFYAMGLAPKPTHLKYMDLSRVDLKKKAGPSLDIACKICSGMAATEAIRILLKKGGVKPVPHFFQFDPFLQKYETGTLFRGNRNPIQKLKIKFVKRLLQKKKLNGRVIPPETPHWEWENGTLPQRIYEFLVEAGIRAPSGDNVQPWKFTQKNGAIYLYLNREVDKSFFNINQIASIVSCGAVLENMEVAACELGISGNITLLPDSADKDLMAKIEFKKAEVPGSPLYPFLWLRHTNRKNYKNKNIPPIHLQDLKNAVENGRWAKLHIVDDRESLRRAAKVIYKADRIRTENRSLHEHFCHMTRFTEQEVQEKRDGLPLKNLEAGYGGEVFLKLTRSWNIMNLFNKTGLGRAVPFHSYLATKNSSALGLLTVPGFSNEDLLKGGRILEHLWLMITQKGLAMQPMTAITLFFLRCQLEGRKSFSQNHQNLLDKVFESYQGIFPEVDFGKEAQVILFRMGYAEEIKNFTLRKKISTFVK